MNTPNPMSDDGLSTYGHQDRESPLSGATHVYESDGEGLRQRAARVGRRLGDVPGRARQRGAQVKDSVSEYTGNRPLTSLALEFVAGMLLVTLVRR